MNNLFQNGPKQINLDGGVTSTNAFKQMVDNMAMNQSQINEKLEQMGQRPTSYADMHLENAFNNMNLNMANPNFQFQEKQNLINLDNQWNGNLNVQNQQQNNLIDINAQMNNNNLQFNNFNANQNFRFGMGAPQVHPMLMEFNKSLHMENQSKLNIVENANQDPLTVEDKNEENSNKENPNDIFKDIIDVMEGQDDERQKNSEFLRFIKKLHTGEIKLNEKANDIEVVQGSGLTINNQLSKNSDIEGIEDEKKLEDMWNKLEDNLNEIDYKMDYENLQKDRLFLPNNQFAQDLGDNIDLLQVAKDFLRYLLNKDF